MFFEVYKKDHKAIVPAILLTFFSFCGLCFLVRDSGKDPGSYGFLLSAVSIVLIFMIQTGLLGLIAKDGHASVKMLRYAFVYGALFGIATDLGVQFELREMTAPGIKGKAVILLCGLCVSLLILPFTYRLFRAVEGKYSFGKSSGKAGVNEKKSFFMGLAGLELFWFPAFLAYYPAIMSYDFNRQCEEAVRGYIWFFEYQPLTHTFLIRMFYLLGCRLGSPAAGMAIFAILQSIVLASSISAGITFVLRRSGRIPAVIWFLMFALLPYNPILAISMTKDILFTAFFVFMILTVKRMTEKPSAPLTVLFIVTGILNILFRNNASYALVFLIPAFLLVGDGVKRKVLTILLTVLMIAAGLGSKTLIRTCMNAIPGSETEKYSVPIMQMVRVTKYQNDNLTQEQRNILCRYIPECSWGDYYPWIADGAKSAVSAYNSSAWIGEANTLIADYITIGKAYPNDFLDAFLGLTIGYWYVGDRSHAEMLGYGDDSDLGLLYTFNASPNAALKEGIPSHSYLPSLERMYSHIVNGNSYLKWPVVSVLMKPAFYFWFFVLDLFIIIYKRNKKSIAVFSYPFFYLMTMFLGPCVNFRYIYPFIAALPILTAVALSEKKTEEAK